MPQHYNPHKISVLIPKNPLFENYCKKKKKKKKKMENGLRIFFHKIIKVANYSLCSGGRNYVPKKIKFLKFMPFL